ncbi:MAG TPA: hypothetical protein VK879_04310 [Candidatus Sulfomarinibacteraceae bacterium]|nr:hypothetical protein [Candidatus Sulfomarinibacteraceae bacterium]
MLSAMVPPQSSDDVFLRTVAKSISKRGLGSLALVALEAGRPLAFLGGQLLWLTQPALCLLWSRNQISRLARLLEEAEAVDSLIEYLQTK